MDGYEQVGQDHTHRKINMRMKTKRICVPLATKISNMHTHARVHNAKAEEYTTPYMRQNIVGGLYSNQGY